MRVPLWAQLLISFASFWVAQMVGEIVAVWSATGDVLAFFEQGLRVEQWKPYIRLSDGRFVSFPVDLFVIFPLWAILGFGTIVLVNRLRRRRRTGS